MTNLPTVPQEQIPAILNHCIRKHTKNAIRNQQLLDSKMVEVFNGLKAGTYTTKNVSVFRELLKFDFNQFDEERWGEVSKSNESGKLWPTLLRALGLSTNSARLPERQLGQGEQAMLADLQAQVIMG